MSNYNDFKNKNTKFTGVEGITVPSGTTAQRGSTTGQWRYNSETGFFEGRNTDGTFSSLEPTPTIISIDVTEIDSNAAGNTTIRVTGTNFTTGGTIKFIGNDATEITASTSTFINASNYDAVIANSSFVNSKEPYDVRFISANGIQATLEDNITVDSTPVWSTASGTIATIDDDATGTHVTVSATDADGDTVTYSVASGSLPGGLSLNSATGAISGDPTNVGSSTTSSFSLRATANSKTVDRSFNIIVGPAPSGGTITTYSYGGTDYKIHKFTSNGNFVIGASKTVDYLIVGGGGGGGHHSGGGGGAGGLVWKTSESLSAGTYAAVIGSGGSTNNNSAGSDGANSTFNSHTAQGGGGGGSGGNSQAGRNGGSGGGGARGQGGGSSTQSSTYGYGVGNSGASSGSNNGSPNYAGYGGGGAGGGGSNRIGGVGNSTFVGDGASTTAFLLAAVAGTDSSNVATSGSSAGTLYIAAGGGGSDQDNATNSDLAGGIGGGGSGSETNGGYAGTTAIANTGGGAGGQGWNGGTRANSNPGATGVVIIRYQV